jgi:hypothetical protein
MVAMPAAPERGDLYGLEVWQRIRPQLPARDPWSRFLSVRWSTLTVGAAVAVFAVAAFIAGRYWPPSERPGPASSQAADPRTGGERARTVAIIDHLERSERVLLDLSNAEGPDVDVSEEQAWPRTSSRPTGCIGSGDAGGETTTASVLDDWNVRSSISCTRHRRHARRTRGGARQG